MMMTDTVIARESQQEQITSLFTKGRLVPCAVLVWGPHSSGKSYTLGKVLEVHKIKHLAQVSAREIICGRRQFLETIVRQLYKCSEKTVDLEKINCENLSAFVKELFRIGTGIKIGSQKLLLVIEEAELLRDEHGDIIEVLSHIQDMIAFNFCAMFLSSLPLSSYSSLLELKNILPIQFPQYNKDELTRIIISKPPPNCDVDRFTYYVTTTINVFYMACRDLRKLQRLAILNFEGFVKTVDNLGTFTQKNSYKVWKQIEPKLAQDFKTLQSNIVPAINFDKEESEQKMKLSKQKVFYQLPEHAKFLLVAAYIASYNPPSSDKRFFVKAQQGKKRKHTGNIVERKDPQIFTQARFFAIYSALTESTPEFNSILMNQITHLCDLKLVSLIGGSAHVFDDPKYKCLVSFHYIKEVARSINVDITHYLYHLVGYT